MMVPIFLAMKYFNYSAHIAFFEAMRLHIYRLQCRVNVTFICTRKQILRVPRFIMMLTLLPGLDLSVRILQTKEERWSGEGSEDEE